MIRRPSAARGAAPVGRRVCLLSFSAIGDDPRVRRQGDAFAQAGWEVVGVGLPGASSASVGWAIVDQPPVRARIPWAFRAVEKVKRALGLLLVRLQPRLAEAVYWSCYPNARHLYALASTVEADLWLANDWPALPVAAKLARARGLGYGYDTHEFAREEFAERAGWRFWKRPLACAIEDRFISGAAVVSAVSAGVAAALDRLYRLPRPSLVVRNTPHYESAPFRPTGERIRVLYHGIVAQGRGLEAAIDSVASWRPGFDLIIRGPENPGFSDALRARIAASGVSDRVRLLPAVPMTQLVREAMPFDIGFFALPGHSRHNDFALPNKFFEYAMAGLALCVSDLPEMAGLVRRYDLGVLIPSVDPAAIANAINGLTRETIDAFKRNALKAASELCWEKESVRMLAAYRSIPHHPAAARELADRSADGSRPGAQRWICVARKSS